MFVTILMFVIPIIQVGIPLYLIYRIWTTDFQLQVSWLIWITHALLSVLTFFTIFRWDITGYGARYWLNILFVIAILLSVIKVKHLPFLKRGNLRWSWGHLAEIVLFIAALIWGYAGFGVEQKTVSLKPPLKGDSHYVIHGESTSILNYHGCFSHQQKYALDINTLNDWGFRANGIFPKQLNKYAAFGDTIYSPINGTVVQASDTPIDQPPPQTMPEKPLGNHIWLKKGNLYVVLAHLKKGRIKVKKGMIVKANQPIANIGNTGNTTEPHLHIHAVRVDENKNPDHESLLYKGESVLIEIQNKGF